MEKSFDFGRLLKNHAKKHKSKPTQFVSVAGGVQKRLENSLLCRKSSRLTHFDSIRNLSRCSSPVPLSKAQQKMEHRRQQLEKWKEEKEKKKKEVASQKKKPFITGVTHTPLNFISLPPPVRPSTSARVTRSQTAWNSKQVKEKQTLSIAPKNATFKPPQFKKVPYVNLVALKPIKSKTSTYTFDPVLPQNNTQKHTVNAVKLTKCRAQNKPVEAKVTRKPSEVKTKSKTTKPLPNNSKTFQSSSSSDDCQFPVLRMKKSLPAPQSLVFQSSTETDSSSKSPIFPVRTRKSRSPNSTILVSKAPRKSTPRNVLEVKQFTSKNPVPKSESSSEERLRSPRSPLDTQMTPEQIKKEAKNISPCVTISRGKDNARKEFMKKLKEGLLDEDTSDIENIDHFRRQLASEIKRMTEMCETWDRVSEQTVLPDSIQECVLSAVGQARLLMSQKMQQFATLVERCARPEPAQALVTPADLLGFWDMIFMQVENIDMRFKKLEELRARGWMEEAPVPVAKKTRRPAPGTKGPVAVPSRLKEMIAAARKAKKEQVLAPVEKTFDAGFFYVKSPVRVPGPHTPLNKPTLLKVVLSNEANKSASKISASFAMLRASVLSKNVECEGVAPLEQTPLPQTNATPGRSILKHTTDAKKTYKKNIKVVLFDQPDKDTLLDEQPVTSRLEELPIADLQRLNIESELPSMDVENEKENSRRKSQRLVRQDAIEECSPMMTRSRRKSTCTPQSAMTPRRSTRKTSVLEPVETNIIAEHTPQRAPRRRRNVPKEDVIA